MEEAIFPLPAVAGKLKSDYIEARLHTDSQGQLTPEVDKRNKELQEEMTHSKANPYFVIYDPVTGKVVRKRAGMIFEQKFIEFLQARPSATSPLQGGGQQ